MTRARATITPWAALILPVALASGAGGCGRLSHGCTEIGCLDQVSLSVRRTDGTPPGLAVSLDIDGRRVECAAPEAGATTACDTDVSIALTEMVSCTEERTEGAKILRCAPTGRFEQIIAIRGTPKVIRATAPAADSVIAERTFEPHYQTVQPNGSDCEPTCHQWSDVWLLP